ncbi:MAG: multicopper oxidase domain-containing protein [Oligoflexia bacterium]|nr:multicopper oxidase domain-containing protein [Oligoflexia bacterium]
MATAATPLDAKTLSKFLDPLPSPSRIDGTLTGPQAPLIMTVSEFAKQILPSDFKQGPFQGKSLVWGYNEQYPGPTIEARRGVSTHVFYKNKLEHPQLQKYLPIDQTLHWADPENMGSHMHTGMPISMGTNMESYAGPIPTVTHLHGAEVESASDGEPEAWFTSDFKLKGKNWVSEIYHYPNSQEATTLWYHDHSLGMTRLTVFSGLVGMYLLRDSKREPKGLPEGVYEREIILQDKSFDTEGQLYFPREGSNPTIHPFWIPEFFGDTITVNGKAWPRFDVEPARYRLRIVNASNARFYNLSFENNTPFWQIGTDGGFLDAPVKLQELLLSPGERADVIVDFSKLTAHMKFLLKNSAKTPFPDGDAPDPETTAQVMQFQVVPLAHKDRSIDPQTMPKSYLRATNPIQKLAATVKSDTPVRHLTLVEHMSETDEPITAMINNLRWMSPVTETPRVGSTEVWEIINTTMDTHPIHLHLVQFQLLNRQSFDMDSYLNAYKASFPGGHFIPESGVPRPKDPSFPSGNLDVTPYLQGAPRGPDANEDGWKDTIRVGHGEVARFVIRWAPTDAPAQGPRSPRVGMNFFPFTPSLKQGELDPLTGYKTGPGYVWHCHILDHEDNDMMRPYKVLP